jgi:hypothetical protein
MPAEILADCCGACGSDTNLVHELLKNVSSVSIKAGAATYEQLLLHAWPVHIYGQGRSKLEFSAAAVAAAAAACLVPAQLQ